MAEVRRQVEIPADGVTLRGELRLPPKAVGVVLFAHGSGSSRHSPRNLAVAATLLRSGLGTLLIDLLTPEEESSEAHTGHLRFDIGLLAGRLQHGANWLTQHEETRNQQIGCFGASTGAAAALVAAANCPEVVAAVVSRGGRPDLAGDALPLVKAPTLLIVGGADRAVLPLNEEALARLDCPKEMVIVPGATHLFEEPGTLDEVARLASEWFIRHLTRQPDAPPAEDEPDLSLAR
ncbi:MAG: dienelactone hydrolase family protein [Actinomycetota bacterium]